MYFFRFFFVYFQKYLVICVLFVVIIILFEYYTSAPRKKYMIKNICIAIQLYWGDTDHSSIILLPLIPSGKLWVEICSNVCSPEWLIQPGETSLICAVLDLEAPAIWAATISPLSVKPDVLPIVTETDLDRRDAAYV